MEHGGRRRCTPDRPSPGATHPYPSFLRPIPRFPFLCLPAEVFLRRRTWVPKPSKSARARGCEGDFSLKSACCFCKKASLLCTSPVLQFGRLTFRCRRAPLVLANRRHFGRPPHRHANWEMNNHRNQNRKEPESSHSAPRNYYTMQKKFMGIGTKPMI